MMKFIDLRSDTVTWPTEEMRDAMRSAEVGDDVYRDDPTVTELENYAASLTGKEAALFVPSGTFGNQLALFTHCERGQEVILDDTCHIVQHEAGASAVIAGVQLRTVEQSSENGFITPEQFFLKARNGNDIHEPRTGLICLENAHSNGRVLPVSFMEEMKYISTRCHVPIHLDGARLFNAAAALNVQAVEITKHADSVMFCLSKGLCAPIGSMLAGTSSFIEKARAKRKLMGGGMRQAGILAAAGLVALREMRSRLVDDHENARYLADELSQFDNIEVDGTCADINMVFFSFKGNTIDPEAFIQFFKSNNILVNEPDCSGRIRFVTHKWITKKHIDETVSVMSKFLR